MQNIDTNVLVGLVKQAEAHTVSGQYPFNEELERDEPVLL